MVALLSWLEHDAKGGAHQIPLSICWAPTFIPGHINIKTKWENMTEPVKTYHCCWKNSLNPGLCWEWFDNMLKSSLYLPPPPCMSIFCSFYLLRLLQFIIFLIPDLIQAFTWVTVPVSWLFLLFPVMCLFSPLSLILKQQYDLVTPNFKTHEWLSLPIE